MHFTIEIKYRQKRSYIRNQMQRDFLTMYNRLEIAVLWFLLFLLIHFCAPDDCGHGHMKLPVGQNKVMHWNEFVNLWGIYKYMIYRHTDLAQIAQKTGRLLLVRSSAPHLQKLSWPTLPPTTSTAWPIPTNRPAILNNPSNPYTIGERDGPENIEQVYRGRLGTLCSANIDHRYHHSICLFIFKERQPDGTSPSTDHSHLSSPLSTQSCKSACSPQPPLKSQHNRMTRRARFSFSTILQIHM